jgi:hypothetical protein
MLIDLVHTDLCSMRDKSIDDAIYFMTFVDDHSSVGCVQAMGGGG